MWSTFKGPTRLWDLNLIYLVLLLLILSIANVLAGNELWPLERPDGMPNIVSLEVMCGKDHMDVHLSFSHPFDGIVSSKGQHSDPRCIYVPPSTGKKFFSFRIAYSRCGTKPDHNGQFYENTVVVQYDKDLLEVWDEAKRLRCEWFNDYEKTASKPPMVIADLDVIQLDFRGDNVDCWMEIQHGKGPWAPPVSGIVPLGSTLTLVVAINDYRGEFDMRVKSCIASDGAGHVIKLSDEFGCVLRPKMISRFLKARAPDERATVITYAFFHAFKFPDALSVHIKCKVEICRHGCLDHCQLAGAVPTNVGPTSIGGNIHERKDTIMEKNNNNPTNHNTIDLLNNSAEEQEEDEDAEEEDRLVEDHDIFYDDIIHRGDDVATIGGGFGNSLGLTQRIKEIPTVHPPASDMASLESIFLDGAGSSSESHKLVKKEEKFPHGPRYFEAQNRRGMPAVAGPRSLNLDGDIEDLLTSNADANGPVYRKEEPVISEKPERNKRSIRIHDRSVRSADVGVSGIYDVISEADLAFSPDTKQEAVTVFQGQNADDVVYGICMPVPGFSILFILVTSAAIISALVAGSLLYRYQLQKDAFLHQKQTSETVNRMGVNTIGSWMTMRLFKHRHCPQHHETTQ